MGTVDFFDLNANVVRHRGLIMGLAMIAIMMFHQPFVFGDPFSEVFHLYGYWGVDVFLFVSGFGLVYSYRKNTLAGYYRNRALRILPAALLVGAVKIIMTCFGLKDYDSVSFPIDLFSINLWFVYAIIVYYAISPLLIAGVERFGCLFFLVVCSAAMACEYIPFSDSQPYLVYYLSWIIQRFPVFVLGMLVSAHPPTGRCRPAVFFVSLLFLLASLIIVLFSHLVRFKWSVPFVYMFIMMATPSICQIIGWIGNLIERFKLYGAMVWIGSLSLELYLWHEFVYDNLHYSPLYTQNRQILWMLAAWVISFALAFATHYILSGFTRICKRRQLTQL